MKAKILMLHFYVKSRKKQVMKLKLFMNWAISRNIKNVIILCSFPTAI
ncbi:hypothetical protein QFZ77_006314 [Paenibacillus sp. V4I3]|nr:hypothetical protein [Paenibacillus sp. V4I3]MDQ0886473.1 hypothetical protein [Paenibacillus sp. V4I9]